MPFIIFSRSVTPLDEMLVNAHHLWEQVAAWAETRGIAVQVELPEILGTG